MVFCARIAFFALFLAAPARCAQPEDLILKARELHLGEQREWRVLLHYYPKLFGGSEIKSPGFFLSPRGRRDAQAELEATLRALYKDLGADPNEHALCRFPARRAWLEGRLGGLSGLPKPDCAKYRAWHEDVRAGSVTVIFASAFLNNPSSMYGHTFLKLNREGREENQKLLDYSVNFAADADTDNDILYALYGLAGRFPGRFSVMPYYLKVQEYSNMDSRDLWEFDLRLDAAAIERMLRHLWELEGAQFPYYFFNKNCSYQLLPLVEAADPGLRLIRRWPLGVIPADTLRALTAQPGPAARITYRPSRNTLLLARRARLTPAEMRLASLLSKGAKTPADLAALPEKRQALVLESAQDYLEYKTDFRKEKEAAAADIRRAILLARSRITRPSDPWSIAVSTSPHEGHETARFRLGWGAADRPFVELAIRPALHDILDPPDGYALNSGIEMFETRLRHDIAAQRTYIEALDFIRILSLSPYDPWILRPSWKLDTGMRTAPELDGRGWKSGYYGFGAGTGLAWQAGPAVAYVLAEADAGLGGIFRRDYRLGGGPTAALALQNSRASSRFEAGYRAYALGDPRPHGLLSWEGAFHASRNASLRLRLSRTASHEEIFLALQGYF